MTTTVSGGTTFGLTATAPGTFNAAGYGALAFTLIGEITDISDFGREWEKIIHKPLASRQSVKRKGGFDDGAANLTFALDEKDAGQQLMETARDIDADYYFKISAPNGAAIYAPVQVFTFKRNIGNRDGIITGTSNLEITGSGLLIVKPA